MPYKVDKHGLNYYECPICGLKIYEQYYIYEPQDDVEILRELFGSSLDHLATHFDSLSENKRREELTKYQECVTTLDAKVRNLLARMRFHGSTNIVVSESELLDLLPVVFDTLPETIKGDENE